MSFQEFYKYRKFVYFADAVVVTVILSSCNLLIIPPKSRENVNDSGAQIINFTAVASGSDSIVSMWTWVYLPGWISNESRIEEIKIIHSTLGYQNIYNPFAGESFTDRSKWEFRWDDLKPDSAHYFSLFLKNEEGTWTPSFKVKVLLPGELFSDETLSRVDSLNIDNGGNVTSDPDPINISNNEWALVVFDIPDDVYIIKADIYISVTALTEIIFAPLDRKIPMDNMEKWNRLQDNDIVKETTEVTYTVSKASYDVTDVVRASVIGPDKAILIKTTDGSSFTIDNNASAPYILVDYYK